MSRIIAILATVALLAAVIATSRYQPSWLSDAGNPLVRDFFGSQMLSVLGVIVTITLASAANLHLELNRLEDASDSDESFPEARSATKSYAYLLIGLFAAAVALVILKPLLGMGASGEALFNGLGVFVVFLNVLALADLTSAVFQIPASRRVAK